MALASGVSPAEGRAEIERLLADCPVARLIDHGEVLDANDEHVDRPAVPVTALLALSVVIALLGIANTLALSIHERIREFGLLRALGMARGQLRLMVRSEAVIIAALGAVLGVVVTLFFGWALVAAMQGLGVTELVLPGAQLLWPAALATVAAWSPPSYPARRAATLPVLEAITAD